MTKVKTYLEYETTPEMKPLTMSAEHLQFIRECPECDPVFRDELLIELDAVNAAHARAMEQLAEAVQCTEG